MEAIVIKDDKGQILARCSGVIKVTATSVEPGFVVEIEEDGKVEVHRGLTPLDEDYDGEPLKAPEIEYRKGGDACSKAWFAYKATVPPIRSLVDFAAGWNAAKADKAPETKAPVLSTKCPHCGSHYAAKCPSCHAQTDFSKTEDETVAIWHLDRALGKK